MALRRFCFLWLVSAFATHTVLAQNSKEFNPSSAVRTSVAYLAKNPERRAALLPADAKIDNLSQERSIEYVTRDETRIKTFLNTPRNTLIDFGRTLLWSNDRANLLRLYSVLYSKLPPKIRKNLVTPRGVKKKPTGKVRESYLGLSLAVQRNLPTLVRTLKPGIPQLLVSNPIADCRAEVGYEFGGVGAEKTDRCEVSEYSPNGLFKNTTFPLKDNLTCIKDQGSRGTCVSQAIAGTIESLANLRSGILENLSEQFVYYRGETEGDSLVDIFEMQNYGLAIEITLDQFVRQGLGVYYESAWNYNQSTSMQNLVGDPVSGLFSHPDSCNSDYFGESCSDFTWQTLSTAISRGVPNPGPPPVVGSSVHRVLSNSYMPGPTGGIAVNYTLQNAIVLLAADVPLIVSMAITDGFASTVGSGPYIRPIPNDPVRGGHSMQLVGFIPNGSLPARVARAAEQGFFIVKNSWGINAGDCGFYYIDYVYMRDHFYYLNFITTN